MTSFGLVRRRSGWDVVGGVILVVAALAIFGDVVAATLISVLFIGWMALVAGVAALVAAVFTIGRGGFWSTALSGALLAVIGLALIRHPGTSILTLTWIAGMLILVSGVTRLLGAFEDTPYRGALVLSGAVSTILGLLILFDIFDASLTLLGFLVGAQALVDGITLLTVGRVHMTDGQNSPASENARVGADAGR